ncbi:MAG: Maf family nucleotide pyrophosphatase [Pseudomonadota bacterium]
MADAHPRLVLASASPARAAVLKQAGIAFEARPSRLDEDELKNSLKAEGLNARDMADALAEAKAIKVSARDSEALVLGGDQILVCNDILFDKPVDMNHAAAHLAALSGKRHELQTALVLAQRGEAIWRHVSVAKLYMRPLSQAAIETYLMRAGDAVLSSVGAYQLEGLGAQLFEKIDGDFFTVLGLPLLPLLQQLRLRAMVLP